MKVPIKTPIRRVSFEPSDNGGFISKTEHEPPARSKNGPYIDYEDCTKTNVHPSVQHAAAHLIASFGGGKKAKRPPAGKSVAPRMGAGAASIGSKMLENDYQ